MKTRSRLIATIVFATLAGAAQAQVDPHHPVAPDAGLLAQAQPPMQMQDNAPAAAPAQPVAPAVPAGPGPMSPTAPAARLAMHDMLQNSMNMMQMMQMMQMNMMQMMQMNMMQMMMGGAAAPETAMPGNPGGAAPMSAATLAYMDAMTMMETQMMQGLQTDDPDLAFVLGMIAHHQAAIEMSRVVLQYGRDESTRHWAEQIIAVQEQEIAEMRQWLAERGR